MRTMIDRYLKLIRDVEGSGGGGGDAPPASTTPDPASVLFPKEGEGETKPPAGDGEKKDGDAKPTEWKEYVPDPNKSEAENAAAKAEHDKTKPADKGDDPANQVPKDGKYDLKMPDGVALDTELANALGPEFASLGLTNAQAQKLVDKYIETQQARTVQRGKAWGETLEKWVKDAKADKDIGGDKWDGTVTTARRAVDKLGTPALKAYLEASGGGNHPELIRFMAKVGTMIKEDDPATGGAEGAGKPANPAHVLFPNDAPKGK